MTEEHHQAREKTYRAIGRFIFCFSQVECLVRVQLWSELNLEKEHFLRLKSTTSRSYARSLGKFLQVAMKS